MHNNGTTTLSQTAASIHRVNLIDVILRTSQRMDISSHSIPFRIEIYALFPYIALKP